MLSRNYVTESEKRKRQIDTLKIFNDNVTEVLESSEYRLEFAIGMNKMFIDVSLSPEFPYEKPTLRINPPVVHPWVAEDSCTIVGAPGLINYTIHSDLGRIVQAIIREFEQKPPTLLDSLNDSCNRPSPSMSSNPSAKSPLFTETVPILSFPDLQKLSIEELMQLNENVDMQDKFLETVPQITELNNTVNKTMDKIEQLAKNNLSKEATLNNLKENLSNRVKLFLQLKSNYEELQSKHSELSKKYSPHAIKAALIESTAQVDEEAEVLADSFLNGTIDCDKFLKEYKIKRKLGHTRKTVQERLSHQLMQLDRAT